VVRDRKTTDRAKNQSNFRIRYRALFETTLMESKIIPITST